jgi:PAS domain S-box-containing protein
LAVTPASARTGEGWERFFWTLFRSSRSPIALVDGARGFVEVNDGFVELAGHTRAELMATSVPSIVVPVERSISARRWETMLLRGNHAGTAHMVRGDGSKVEVDFAGQVAAIGGRELVVYVFSSKGAPWPTPAAQPPGEGSLTNREREVITLIALGSETGEIAGQLCIASETVRSHVRNAMAKLGAHTRAQLVAEVMIAETALDPSHFGDISANVGGLSAS